MLAQRGVDFTERDFLKQRLTPAELAELAVLRSPTEWFSWASVRARKEGWRPGAFDDAELLRLMADDPTLIRRPLVRVGEALVAGNDAKALDSALAGRT